MSERPLSSRGFREPLMIFSLCAGAILIALFFFGASFRLFVRESFMQRATSAHYEILSPRGVLPPEALMDFATKREAIFATLDKKLGGAGTNTKIRIVFDPEFRALPHADGIPARFYSVSGTTIRTTVDEKNPRLPATADAEALLNAAWGKPGNAQIAMWVATWLAGNWRGMEIGMAAAEVEQRLGHKRLASVLSDPGGEISHPDDRNLLGAAWINEIAEFGGPGAVRKLYAAKMPHPNVADVANVLGTAPLELDRQWQLWIFAYLAGMPSMPSDSGMPMNMPMAGSTR
jgi:hypothetical protein